MRLCRLVFVFALGATFSVSAAQAADDVALEFNEAVVNANKRLEDGGFEYGKVLVPAFQERPVDSAALAKKQSELKVIYADVVKKMNEAKIPDSPEARAFFKAHQRFLDGQKELVDSDLTAIQRVIDDANLDAKAKKSKIEGILDSMELREKKAHQELLAAQDAFAKKHNLIIKKEDE